MWSSPFLVGIHDVALFQKFKQLCCLSLSAASVVHHHDHYVFLSYFLSQQSDFYRKASLTDSGLHCYCLSTVSVPFIFRMEFISVHLHRILSWSCAPVLFAVLGLLSGQVFHCVHCLWRYFHSVLGLPRSSHCFRREWFLIYNHPERLLLQSSFGFTEYFRVSFYCMAFQEHFHACLYTPDDESQGPHIIAEFPTGFLRRSANRSFLGTPETEQFKKHSRSSAQVSRNARNASLVALIDPLCAILK